jgi:cyclophilin family peptidyl-prolyl cis-trans isomerase/HEAT repeat protein
VARSDVPPAAVALLRQLASAGRADTSLDARRLRTVAAAALAGSGVASTVDLASILDDPAPYVRREAAAALAGPAQTSAATLLPRVLADTVAAVRYEGVRALGRQGNGAAVCGALGGAASDPDDNVALMAIDLLASCTGAAAVARLDSIAGTLDGVERWHRPVHALFALARRSPPAAAARLEPFVASPSFFVRAWAAQAAGAARDTAALRRLAADAHPNVRTAAVSGLAPLAGHAADSLYIAQLDLDDSQLLQEAAKALDGSTSARAVPALLAALARVTALRRETSRDARMALLERIGALGNSANAAALGRYTTDFDPAVAERAAEIIGRWTGDRPAVAPQPLPRLPLPTVAELRALEDSHVVLRMQSGDSIVIALFPFDAPTNTARFVRLARTGAFDGRTFHRVVPNFVIQGGSPGANEYAGDASFTRDELGLRYNWRGTVGLSTRGRDTGDGQMYINLIDNVRLDHDYTIYGVVVSGMDAVDRALEGALITRAIVR